MKFLNCHYLECKELCWTNKKFLFSVFYNSTRSVYLKVGLVNQVSFRAVEDQKPSLVGAGVSAPTNLLSGIQNQDKVEVKPSKAELYKTRLKDPEWEK